MAQLLAHFSVFGLKSVTRTLSLTMPCFCPKTHTIFLHFNFSFARTQFVLKIESAKHSKFLKCLHLLHFEAKHHT
jgi:hypothetical protein